VNHTAYRVGVRVEDRVGNRGTVIESPWDSIAGWVCKVAWDSETITASGTSDERIVNLMVI
jgi:hypothetical protein